MVWYRSDFNIEKELYDGIRTLVERELRKRGVVDFKLAAAEQPWAILSWYETVIEVYTKTPVKNKKKIEEEIQVLLDEAYPHWCWIEIRDED